MSTNFDFSGDAIYAAATDTQDIAVADTHQELKFLVAELDSTWDHTTATGIFTCQQTGRYACILEVYMKKTTGSSKEAGMRATFDGVEIAKSHSGIDLIANNERSMFSSTFQFDGVEGKDLKVEVAGNDTVVQVTPGPNPGSADTVTSATINIWRLA